LIGVHTFYDEGPFICRRPPLQPSVLEVGPLFLVPILVEWRIVLNRLPQVQTTSNDAIRSLDSPRTLNVQRELTDRTTIYCSQRPELERAHVRSTSNRSQRKSDDLRQRRDHLLTGRRLRIE